ncbi:hypothetical protein UlMin_013090 [Ulmus minor]
MSDAVAQQIFSFRSHFLNRRFDNSTLRVLESVSVSKDVKSSMEVRSSLREFIRSESVSVIRENAEKHVEEKLLVLDFLVRTFALIGDVESCLALRYEAFLLREFKSTINRGLKVSFMEWIDFAEQSLEYGFHSIVIKACENAQLCFHRDSKVDAKAVECFNSVEVIEKIKRLKECAITSAGSNSVQAQAAEYSRSKLIERIEACSSVSKGPQLRASSLFRNGVRKRNLRKLHQSQSMLGMTNEPYSSQV